MIKKTVRAVLIVTGDLGRHFIKTAYNGLDTLNNISSAVNYCGDIEINRQYFKNYPVVKHFATHPENL